MLKKHKVLIVDDDVMIVNFLKEILSREYTIKTVLSGEDALKILHEFAPDVVLLDVMMPGIDGYDVCRFIRSDAKLAKSKVVFLTAKMILDDKIKAYDVGADDYIVKPFEKSELLAKIRVFTRLKYEESTKFSADIIEDRNTLRILYEITEHMSDIIYIKAESPYCKIFRKNSNKYFFRLRGTIKNIEDYFQGKGLVRVHRSFLINPTKILSLTQQKNRDYKVVLSAEKEAVEIPVGRTYYSRIKNALEMNL